MKYCSKLQKAISLVLVISQFFLPFGNLFAASANDYNQLVDAYNNTLAKLYSNDSAQINSSAGTLKNLINSNPALSNSDAYASGQALTERVDRMNIVKAQMDQCKLKRCDPGSTHCVDLGIDKEIMGDLKDVDYVSDGSTLSCSAPTGPFGRVGNPPGLAPLVSGQKSNTARSASLARSSDCTMARNAAPEYFLNQMKSLMRLLKRYSNGVLSNPNDPEGDQKVLNYALDQALKCDSSKPTSYCNLTRENLKTKGLAFLQDKQNGLGAVKRLSSDKVASGLSLNFRQMNILYLDSESQRAPKCNAAHYNDIQEQSLKSKYNTVFADNGKLNTLYVQLKDHPEKRSDYDALYAKYQSELNEYNQSTTNTLKSYRDYGSACSERNKRAYGYGGVSDGHVWSGTQFGSGTVKQSEENTKNYNSLTNQFEIDYLRLMNGPDGMLLATDTFEEKSAYKTFKGGITPAGAINENVSAADVNKAVREQAAKIIKDMKEMEHDYPLEQNAEKLSGCEDQLQTLTQKDPLAISKALMDHPSGGSAVCSAIQSVNSKAQNIEYLRVGMRATTATLLGVGAFMSCGALLGASPEIIAAAASADLALGAVMTAGSGLAWRYDEQALNDATLKNLKNQALSRVNVQDTRKMLDDKVNRDESRTDTYMNGANLLFAGGMKSVELIGGALRSSNLISEGASDVTRLETKGVEIANSRSVASVKVDQEILEMNKNRNAAISIIGDEHKIAETEIKEIAASFKNDETAEKALTHCLGSKGIKSLFLTCVSEKLFEEHGITVAEQNTLARYKQNDFKNINNDLRGIEMTGPSKLQDGDAQKIGKLLNKTPEEVQAQNLNWQSPEVVKHQTEAMDKFYKLGLPVHEGPLYRGAFVDDAQLAQLKAAIQKDPVTFDKAYLSTTSDFKVVRDESNFYMSNKMIKQNPDKNPIVYVMKSDENIPVDLLTGTAGEKEYLVNRGASFKISEVTDIKSFCQKLGQAYTGEIFNVVVGSATKSGTGFSSAEMSKLAQEMCH